MSASSRFEFESYQDPETLRDQLASILDGLVQGSITLATEGQEITLTPGRLLKVSLKARRKDGESLLSLKLTWKDPRVEDRTAEKSISIRSGS